MGKMIFPLGNLGKGVNEGMYVLMTSKSERWKKTI